MYSLDLYVVSGAPEDCRYPEDATFTVNGVEGELIAEPGPGDDCSGSVFLYMNDALAAVSAAGPDAEVRLTDASGAWVVLMPSLVGEHRVVPSAETVATGSTLDVTWSSDLPFGDYASLDLLVNDEVVADVAPSDSQDAPNGAWSFPVEVEPGPVVFRYLVTAGLLTCVGDVPCDDAGSRVDVSGEVPLEVIAAE
jgi:hypothetical protein